MELRRWSIVSTFGGHMVVTGQIYGDTKGRFLDGETVTTSIIQSIDVGSRRVFTMNSVYTLGR